MSDDTYTVSRSTMEKVAEALNYYGDPMTYFGIAMFGDAPHGDFFDDFEKYPWPGDYSIQDKPGRRAREVSRDLAAELEPQVAA
jgi:hypothetical protein